MDNNNKVRIKCPCGANLVLTKTPGMEAKTYTCPVCHQPHPFTEYTLLPPLQSAPAPAPAPKPAPAPAPAAPETVDVLCPCGAKLRVKRVPGIETKTLTCPKCGQKRPFTQYRGVSEKSEEGDGPVEPGKPEVPGGTIFGDPLISSLPHLLDTATGKTYQLCEGNNLVGRCADSSHADIKILTNDKKLSREHFIVIGKKIGKQYKFFIRLHKKEVNATRVNNDLLDFGDEIFLQNNSTITVNQTTLKFVVIDTESTIC